MKKAFLFFLFLLCLRGFSVETISKRIDASVTNIPSSPTRDGVGLVIQVGAVGYKSIEIDNKRGSGEIAVNCQYAGPDVPDVTHKSWIYVDQKQSKVFDNETIGKQCFLYTPSGSPLTSGIYIVHIWGQ